MRDKVLAIPKPLRCVMFGPTIKRDLDFPKPFDNRRVAFDKLTLGGACGSRDVPRLQPCLRELLDLRPYQLRWVRLAPIERRLLPCRCLVRRLRRIDGRHLAQSGIRYPVSGIRYQGVLTTA
jgi:hypothetical protein